MFRTLIDRQIPNNHLKLTVKGITDLREWLLHLRCVTPSFSPILADSKAKLINLVVV